MRGKAVRAKLIGMIQSRVATLKGTEYRVTPAAPTATPGSTASGGGTGGGATSGGGFPIVPLVILAAIIGGAALMFSRLLARPGDTRELSRMLLSVMDDSDVWRSMSTAARRMHEARPDDLGIAHDYIRVSLSSSAAGNGSV